MSIINEIKKEIEKEYGSLDNPCGCYLNGKWLSIENLVKLIDKVGSSHSEVYPHTYEVCATVSRPGKPMVARGFQLSTVQSLDVSQKNLSFHRMCVEIARLTGTPCSDNGLNVISVNYTGPNEGK